MVRLVAADNRIVQCAAVRKDGWTKARREGFFAMLSATCNVRASAAAMGMTDCGAYYVRRRDPVFAAQWQEALAEGYGRLEQALMALALEGIDPAPAIEAGIEQARAATCGEAKTEGFGAERRRVDAAAGAADGGGDAVVPGVGREAGAGARGGDGVIVGSLGGTPGIKPAITSVDLALRLLARNADRVAGTAGGRGRKARASAEETDAALIKQLDALARRIAVSEAKRVGDKLVEHGVVEHGAMRRCSMLSIGLGMWCGGGLSLGLGWCRCCGSIGVWRLGLCPLLRRMRGGCGSRGWLRIRSWLGWCGVGRWLGCRLGIGRPRFGRGFGGSCCRSIWSRLVWWRCLCRFWRGLRYSVILTNVRIQSRERRCSVPWVLTFVRMTGEVS